MPKASCILMMDVDNEFGVLTRITALIRRAGLNIKGLSVAETLSPAVSRLTVSVETQGFEMGEVAGRIRRLNCVRQLQICDEGNTVQQEMALLLSSKGDPARLWEGRPVLWEDEDRVCFQVTMSPRELDRFVTAQADHLLDVSRSGAVTIAIGKGE